MTKTTKIPVAGITRRQERAIAALLTQPNVAEAARVAGIAPQTLARWMKDPVFEASWRADRSAGLDQAILRLQKIAGAAVSALLKVMVDPSAPPAARLRACEIVYRHARAARELEDIETRLSNVERANPSAKRNDEGSPVRVTTEGAGLLRKKEATILALLTQRNIEEAARAVNITAQTLYRWMKTPEFDAAWRKAGREAYGAGHRASSAGSERGGHNGNPDYGRSSDAGVNTVRSADLALSLGRLAAEQDVGARLAQMGFAPEVAQAVLNGDRRPFHVIERDLLVMAA